MVGSCDDAGRLPQGSGSAADTLELAQCLTDALQRLEAQGVSLNDDARNVLLQLPLRMQLLGLELIARYTQWEKEGRRKQDMVACPLCKFSFHHGSPEQSVAAQILWHLYSHEVGHWQNAVPYDSQKGALFAVSASMLGTYFELGGCSRFLHRRTERRREGDHHMTVLDIEATIDPVRTANIDRGDDHETQIIAHLKGHGLPRGEPHDFQRRAQATRLRGIGASSGSMAKKGPTRMLTQICEA